MKIPMFITGILLGLSTIATHAMEQSVPATEAEQKQAFAEEQEFRERIENFAVNEYRNNNDFQHEEETKQEASKTCVKEVTGSVDFALSILRGEVPSPNPRIEADYNLIWAALNCFNVDDPAYIGKANDLYRKISNSNSFVIQQKIRLIGMLRDRE